MQFRILFKPSHQTCYGLRPFPSRRGGLPQRQQQAQQRQGHDSMMPLHSRGLKARQTDSLRVSLFAMSCCILPPSPASEFRVLNTFPLDNCDALFWPTGNTFNQKRGSKLQENELKVSRKLQNLFPSPSLNPSSLPLSKRNKQPGCQSHPSLSLLSWRGGLLWDRQEAERWVACVAPHLHTTFFLYNLKNMETRALMSVEVALP